MTEKGKEKQILDIITKLSHGFVSTLVLFPIIYGNHQLIFGSVSDFVPWLAFVETFTILFVVKSEKKKSRAAVI